MTPHQSDLAVSAAMGVIKLVEGEQLAVLAQTMAILGAYAAAQFRALGHEEPVQEMHELLALIGRRAEAHFDADVIVRTS